MKSTTLILAAGERAIRIFAFSSMMSICIVAYCSRIVSAQTAYPDSGSPNASPSNSYSPGYDVALAQRNGNKRQQMVQNAVSNWEPPQQLVTSSSSVGVSKLCDPFANAADSAPAPCTNTDLPIPTSSLATESQVPNAAQPDISDTNVAIEATREIAEHETGIPTTPGSAVRMIIENTTGLPMSISSAVENAVANSAAELGFSEAAEAATGPIGAAVAAFGSSSTASPEEDSPLLWQQQWQDLQEEIQAYQFYKSHVSQIEQFQRNNLFAAPAGQTPAQWTRPQIQNGAQSNARPYPAYTCTRYCNK